MLIAMCLTAVIGAVMFQTWNMVAQNGMEAAKIVKNREKERIAFALMDNDIGSMIFPGEENQNLPAPAPAPIELSDDFYEAMDRKKENIKDRNIITLLSFAGGSSLSQESEAVGLPFCIEYNLRKTESGFALERRERQNCGISGDFPWQESVVLDNLKDAKFEMIFPNGRKLTQWQRADLSPQPVAVRLAWTAADNQEKEILFPVLPRRIEVEWEEK